MLLVARLGENVTVLAESSCVVRTVESRLVERVGVPIDLVDCLGACAKIFRLARFVQNAFLNFPRRNSLRARDFIVSNSDQRTMLFVKSSFVNLNILTPDLPHVPQP